MTLHDAAKTIQNRVYVSFFKKEQKPVLKKNRIKKTGGLFFLMGFSQP